MHWKQSLKPFVPPVLWALAARGRNRIRWTGDYSSWGEAEAAAGGYDRPEIARQVSGAVARVLRGDAAYERDGVTFREAAPNLPLLAAFSQMGREPVNVVDFGGSLGSTYLQNRAWLADHAPRWQVVEQPGFVAEGRRLFPGGEISFVESARDLAPAKGPTLLLLSSVLQYLPDPEATLRTLLRDIRPNFVFLDRLSYWPGERHRLTLQIVPPTIYAASYPCWFFARGLIEAPLAAEFRPDFRFPALDVCADFPSSYEGSFWRRR